MHQQNDFDDTRPAPSFLLRTRDFIKFVCFMVKVIGFIALEFCHIIKRECWQRRLYGGLLLLGVGFSFCTMEHTKPVLTPEMIVAHNWWKNGAEMPEDYYEAKDRYTVAQEQADLVKVWFWRLREPYSTLGFEYQSIADNWLKELAILELEREKKIHLVRVYRKILVRQHAQAMRDLGRMMHRTFPFLFKRETLYDEIVNLSDDEKQDAILLYHLCFIFVCPTLYVFKLVKFTKALKVQVFASSIHYLAYIAFGI